RVVATLAAEVVDPVATVDYVIARRAAVAVRPSVVLAVTERFILARAHVDVVVTGLALGEVVAGAGVQRVVAGRATGTACPVAVAVEVVVAVAAADRVVARATLEVAVVAVAARDVV